MRDKENKVTLKHCMMNIDMYTDQLKEALSFIENDKSRIHTAGLCLSKGIDLRRCTDCLTTTVYKVRTRVLEVI